MEGDEIDTESSGGVRGCTEGRKAVLGEWFDGRFGGPGERAREYEVLAT